MHAGASDDVWEFLFYYWCTAQLTFIQQVIDHPTNIGITT